MPVLLLVVGATLVFFTLALPELDIVSALGERIDSLTNEDSRTATSLDRMRAMEDELSAWSNGTRILGRGLSFFQGAYDQGTDVEFVAYNHVGYVTYLSQLGIVGLLIYGIYLPLTVLRSSRRVWLNFQGEATRFLGLLTGATFVVAAIVYLANGSLLSQSPVEGVLAGAVWALSRQRGLSGTL
jgi:hypothetical protein